MEVEVLHKKKLLAPKLRFKRFDDIWENRNMGELGSFMGGGTPATSVEKYWIGDIPWISSSDLFEDDLFNINIHRYLNKEAISESATKVIPKNSVLLISRVGVGKLAVNRTELCTSQDFSNFIPSECDSYFIGYFLLARKNLLINFAQGTSIKGFTTSDIKSLNVTIPTLPEQQKIASFLSAVDEKIQQLTRKKELLEQYKKGVMQQLFSGKLRFKDEDGKAFPNWEEKRLGDLTYKVGKKNKENIKYPIYSINNQEGFRPQSEQFDGLDSNDRGYDISLYKIFNAKTFAYNPARINVGSIGYSHNIKEGIVSSLYVCFKTKEELEDLYLLRYLDSYNFKKDILRFEEGGVRQYLFSLLSDKRMKG
jgi:type I restriction enzyme, S subunit